MKNTCIQRPKKLQSLNRKQFEYRCIDKFMLSNIERICENSCSKNHVAMNFYVYSTVRATNDDKNKKKLIRGHKSSQQAKMRSRERGLRKRHTDIFMRRCDCFWQPLKSCDLFTAYASTSTW